jgi:hypothetical protein
MPDENISADIERLCRAACRADIHTSNEALKNAGVEHRWINYERMVRAILAELREPTEAMGHAGLRVAVTKELILTENTHMHQLTEQEADAINLADCLAGNPSRWAMPTWRAMIDVLLGKK